jgi:excisionase family DNA binding protein
MGDKAETTQLGGYITSAEAARILDLTQRRIAQLCNEGELDGVKLARRWFVKRDSVYAYKRRR